MSLFKKINIVIWSALGLGVLYGALTMLFSLTQLIIILNGIFIGSMCAIGIAYKELIVNSIIGNPPYDRVRQMTLGFFLCWIAYVISALSSVYLRSAGYYTSGTYLLTASRYVAIIAAWLQVTAPDFGLGLFHGRDRKILAVSVSIGIGVSVLIIVAQTGAFT